MFDSRNLTLTAQSQRESQVKCPNFRLNTQAKSLKWLDRLSHVKVPSDTQTLRAARLLSLKDTLDKKVEQIRTRLVHQQAPADQVQSTLATCAEQSRQVISWAAGHTEATWWIDRRKRGDNEFLAEASNVLQPTG
jgi:hypothetical protein